MKLWLISQSENNGYDTYDSAVVAAETEEEARVMYPGDPCYKWKWSGSKWQYHGPDGQVFNMQGYSWVDPVVVDVQFLADGYQGPAGTVCASFNAG